MRKHRVAVTALAIVGLALVAGCRSDDGPRYYKEPIDCEWCPDKLTRNGVNTDSGTIMLTECPTSANKRHLAQHVT